MTKTEIRKRICYRLRSTLINAFMHVMADNHNAEATAHLVNIQAGGRGALLALAFDLNIKIKAANYLPAPLKIDPFRNYNVNKPDFTELKAAAKQVLYTEAAN